MSEYLRDKFIEDYERHRLAREKKQLSTEESDVPKQKPFPAPTQQEISKEYVISILQDISRLENANRALNLKVEELENEIVEMRECFEKTKYFGRFKRDRDGF